MTLRRLVVLIVAVVAICIVNVYHHALAVKYGYEIGRLQATNAQMQNSIAVLEGRVAMLGSPSRLRGENDRLQLGLVSPSRWHEAPTAVALARLTPSEPEIVER